MLQQRVAHRLVDKPQVPDVGMLRQGHVRRTGHHELHRTAVFSLEAEKVPQQDVAALVRIDPSQYCRM